MSIEKAISRRRTFAIISHPDAGKTTLTEKLLLYGGCIDTAGAVSLGIGTTVGESLDAASHQALIDRYLADLEKL